MKKGLSKLAGYEGFRPTVYRDTTGHPTIGFGFNLAAPETLTVVKSFGYDPEKLYNEQQQMSLEDAIKIKEELYGRSRRRVQDIFKDIPLKENQIESLASLHYNNPSLIGENLRRLIMKGDYAEAAKEIAFRSNRAKDPGIAKRRLMEADTFYDHKFNTLPVEPQYAKETSDLLNKIGDNAEMRQLKTQFTNLNPERIQSVGFPKMNLRFGRAPASEPSGSMSPELPPPYPIIPFPIPENIEAEVAQEDFITPTVEQFDPLDYLNLLNPKRNNGKETY